jgi:hypothetical protein
MYISKDLKLYRSSSRPASNRAAFKGSSCAPKTCPSLGEPPPLLLLLLVVV